MTETVTTAVAKVDNTPGAMVKRYEDDFKEVLPSHLRGATWVRLAVGLLRRDKALAQVAARNPGSLMQALLECARLGHEPGTEAFYLIPMGGEVEGWEGYRGVVERMYRAGAVVSVKAEVVKANDRFHYQPSMDRPEHEVDWFSDRGETLGAYAYAEMRDGATSKVVVISQEYLAKVKAMSKGSDKASSPWQKWTDAMVLKTALHRLEPFVPTSAEYLRERIRAVRDVAAEPAAVRPPAHQPSEEPVIDVSHLPDADTVDAEVVSDADGVWLQILEAAPAEWGTPKVESDFTQFAGVPAEQASAAEMQRYLEHLTAAAAS